MAQETIKITTIIPTFNRANLLKGAIKSVLAQSYPHFQVLVLDNASTDNTKEVVEEFAKSDKRVIYHRHSKNIGLSANFQYGYVNVDTSFFSFLSDDNRLFPWFYEEAIQNFTRYPDAGFFAGNTVVIEEVTSNNPYCISMKNEGYHLPHLQQDFKQFIKVGVLDCVIFNNKIKKRFPILDSSSGIAFDCDLLWKLSLTFPYVSSKKRCAIFKVRASSASHNLSLSEFHEMFLLIKNNIQSICPSNEQKKEIDKIFSEHNKSAYLKGIAALFLDRKFEEIPEFLSLMNNTFFLDNIEKLQLYIISLGCRYKFMFLIIFFLIFSRRKVCLFFKKLKNRKVDLEMLKFLSNNAFEE